MSFTESLDDLVLGSDDPLLGKHPCWERVRLSEIGDVLNGFAFSSKAFSKTEGTDLIRIRDIVEGTTETKYSGEFDPLYLVDAGDLLVGMDGDFNRAIWRGDPALLNQRVCKIQTDERFYRSRFLFHVLPGYLQAINRATSSVTVKHLSSLTLQDLPIPLPSAQEQDRIIAEVEKQFSRLDAATAALKRVQVNLKRYRASVLKAACEGRLVPTEAELARKEGREYELADRLLERILRERRARWEADTLAKMIASGKPPKDDGWKRKYKEPSGPSIAELPPLPIGWCWTALDQLIVVGPQNGLYKPAGSYGAGTPIVRIDDFQNDWHRSIGDLKCLRLSDDEHSTYRIEQDDILINRVNSPSHLAKSVAVPTEWSGAVFESNMMRFQAASFISIPWLLSYLYSQEGKSRLTSNAKWAVNQASINQDDVRNTPVPLAPYEEQARIAERISTLLVQTSRTAEQLSAQVSRASRLRQSVLQAAFCGRLLAQDPTDEPASVLLDRIRAERSASGLQTVTRRRKQELVHA